MSCFSPLRASLAPLLLLALVGCDQTTTATFNVGMEASLSTEDFSVPEALREETASGPRVRELACDGVPCPSTAEAPVVCTAGICDPEPLTISAQVGDVVDLDELAGDLDDVVGEIDSLEILEVNYQVSRNTLTIPVEDVEILWGPAGAASVDASGVQRLGVVPAIAAGSTGEGAVQLDAAGSAGFTSYYETTAHRFKFFVRTGIDLMPAGAFPEGELDVAVTMRVRITGSLL